MDKILILLVLNSGLDYTYFPAIDGKSLTDEVLIQKGIKMMPNYGKILTNGERNLLAN